LHRRPHMWSITVTESKSWWVKPTLVIEEYATRKIALTRFDEVSDQIESGELTPEADGVTT
jgi:hypothetical protein